MLDTPTFAEWEAEAERWGLRRVGRELVGPCPRCGGTDRFHVREENASALVGCRQCIDGQPQGHARYGEIVQRVFGFGDRFLPKSPKSSQIAGNASVGRPRPQSKHSAHSRSRTTELGRRIWRESLGVAPTSSTDPPDTSPPRLWFAARSLLHPWQVSPPALRWHDREKLLVAGLWPIGAIQDAWPEIPEDNPPAVHCIAIDEEGRKRHPTRWVGDDKRTYGCISGPGAILALGDPGDTDEPVHIVEGLADALAVYSRRCGLVLATITTVHAILNRPGVVSRLYGHRVLIWPDQDSPGLESANKLAEGLKAAGITHSIAQDDEALDPADWSARQGWPEFDPDTFTETAGRFLDAGQPPAEADRSAVHTLMQGVVS